MLHCDTPALAPLHLERRDHADCFLQKYDIVARPLPALKDQVALAVDSLCTVGPGLALPLVLLRTMCMPAATQLRPAALLHGSRLFTSHVRLLRVTLKRHMSSTGLADGAPVEEDQVDLLAFIVSGAFVGADGIEDLVRQAIAVRPARAKAYVA